MNKIKLVATDLDGTFLKNDKSISQKNLDALHILGEKKVVRAVATGRNLQKVKEVLSNHVPFDFVVYSSGAGVFDWKTQKHIYNQNIEKESATKIINYLVENDMNFHAFFPTPENHKHWFFRGNEKCEEFERYFGFNKDKGRELNLEQLPGTNMCQFLLIIREDERLYAKTKSEIEALCPEIRVIRASSPLTDGYIWIEVFHKSVSKGNGIKHICDLLQIPQSETMGIGNDYNDVDLLDFTARSFFTDNTPDAIKHRYEKAPSNEDDAFAFVVQEFFKQKL